MASGSWNFGTSNPNIEGRVEWWANQQGAVNNYSNIRVRVLFHRTNSGYQSWGTLNTRVRLDTANADTRAKDFSTYVTLTEPGNWVTVCDNSSYSVYHNSDGKKSCYIRVYGDADFGCSFDSSKTVNFDTIPRYTSITNWLAASTTNSSITFNWSTADAISNIVCLFNGAQKYSSSVNASSGSFTINGLTESTTYSNITIKVTRKDSGLVTTSSALSAATTWTSHTSNLSLNTRSINSITLNWSSNYACDAIWIYNGNTPIYSASGLNTTNGTVTLSPNNWPSIQPEATYSLKINVRRKASQWGQMSAAISVTTLALPVVNSSTPKSFNIKNKSLTVYVSNAANAEYSLIFQTEQTSWTTFKTINVAKGTASTSIAYAESELYARCPSENSLPTRVTCQVTVNSKTYTSTYYGITAQVTDSNPSFTDFSWETNIDTNINDVISGSQNMIAGYGKLRLKFEADCAAALNYATLKSLEAKILFNGSVITSGTIDYSPSEFIFDVSTANITTAGTYTIQINALDSRKNKSAVKSHSFNVYPYQRPSVSANLYRFNNFEQATFIEMTGKIAKITVSDVQKNAITSVKYRVKESGTSYPDAYTVITGYSTNSVNGTDNLLLSFNKTKESDPFATLSYEKSYVFQFVLTDKLFASDPFEVTVEQGIPLMSVSEDGYIGVGLVPDFNTKAKLQVSTDIIAKDSNGKSISLLEKINSTQSTLLNMIYPVGSIYMSANSTNPSSLFGGTWIQWGAGRVPVGVNTSDGDFNTVEKTGGAKTHTLTSAQIPSHNHSIPANTASSSGSHGHSTQARRVADALCLDDAVLGWRGRVTIGQGESITSKTAGNITGRSFYIDIPALTVNAAGAHTHGIPASTTGAIGSSGAHNNVQPYITCYMWKRTA
jgi:microcystin-dependent protein